MWSPPSFNFINFVQRKSKEERKDLKVFAFLFWNCKVPVACYWIVLSTRLNDIYIYIYVFCWKEERECLLNSCVEEKTTKRKFKNEHGMRICAGFFGIRMRQLCKKDEEFFVYL